ATDAIKLALTSTQDMIGFYLSDLADADLLVRPAASANHIAWQLGHLISSEAGLLQQELPDAVYPELPAGFADRHSNKNASLESAQGLATKAQYQDLFMKTRAATIAT